MCVTSTPYIFQLWLPHGASGSEYSPPHRRVVGIEGARAHLFRGKEDCICLEENNKN